MLWLKKRELGWAGRERMGSVVGLLALVLEVLVVLVELEEEEGCWFFLRRESRCEMRRFVAANLRVFFARDMLGEIFMCG